MSYSKSVGILLILVAGLSISLQGRAAEAKKAPAKKAVAKKKNVAVKKNAVSTNSIATAQGSSKSTLELEKPTTPVKSPFAAAVIAEYYPQGGKHKDAAIGYALDGRYRFNPSHLIRVFQAAQQQLRPEDKFGAEDAQLFHYYRFNPDIKDNAIGLRTRIIVGTSEGSRANGLNSIEQVRLEFAKNFEKFSFGLRPYFSHYSTDYSTNAKGEPLPLFALGHNLALGYKFTDRLSIDAEVDTGFNMLQPDEVKRARVEAEQAGEPTDKLMDTTTSAFAFVVELGYAASQNIRLHLGYAQADKLMSEGKYGVEFLDTNTSRGYLGVAYAF